MTVKHGGSVEADPFQMYIYPYVKIYKKNYSDVHWITQIKYSSLMKSIFNLCQVCSDRCPLIAHTAALSSQPS
jgi:hypothetical protein